MNQNFKSKKSKDVETAAESIIPNTSFSTHIINRLDQKANLSITQQHLESDNFDTFIEKQK